MAYRYRDGAALYNGALDAFGGGLTAAGYTRLSRWATGKNADLVADVMATLLPKGLSANNSGICAKQAK